MLTGRVRFQLLQKLRPVHITPFSYENRVKLLRFCLALTLHHCENRAFQKKRMKRINLIMVRFENDPFLV